MFTNKTTRMTCVFAIVAATTLELVTAACMTASDSALALKVSSYSHSINKGKTSNSNSSTDTINTKTAKVKMILLFMNANLRRGHREEAEEQEKQIREEWEEIEWKMSAKEHSNYTNIDIEHDLPLPIINFR